MRKGVKDIPLYHDTAEDWAKWAQEAGIDSARAYELLYVKREHPNDGDAMVTMSVAIEAVSIAEGEKFSREEMMRFAQWLIAGTYNVEVDKVKKADELLDQWVKMRETTLDSSKEIG